MTPVNRLTPAQERGLAFSVAQERKRDSRFKERRRYLTFGLSLGAAAGLIAGSFLDVNASPPALGCVFVAAWVGQEIGERK